MRFRDTSTAQKLDHTPLFCFCEETLNTLHYYEYRKENENQSRANEGRLMLFRPVKTVDIGLNITNLLSVASIWISISPE
jgi:hypothetical protein